MSQRLIYKILKLISRNGNLMLIAHDGYLFSQISTFFDALKSEDYIEFADEILVLTKKGYDFVKQYEIKHNVTSKWLLSQDYMWTTPKDKFAIYIPR